MQWKRNRLVAAWVLAVALLAATGVRPSELPPWTGHDWSTWLLADPDAALAAVCTGLAWLGVCWFAIGYLAVAGSRHRGRRGRWARRLAQVLLPRLIRTTLESAVGLTVALGPSLPAFAAGTPAPLVVASASASAPAADAVPALPSLDRTPTTTVELAPLPAVPAPVLAPPDPTPAGSAPDPVLGGRLPDEAPTVVVRRGDCLWTLVERQLGPNADPHAVAQSVQRWFAANREVIGADPDVLLPGQRLRIPTGAP